MSTAVSRLPMPIGSSSRAKWSLVSIETEDATYVGRIFVPETKKRLSDVLCDDRPFVNLTEVSINGQSPAEPFMAINKNCIRTVRVLEEDVVRTQTDQD